MAYLYAWTTASPVLTDLVHDGAQEIREGVKAALNERIQSIVANIDNDPWQFKNIQAAVNNTYDIGTITSRFKAGYVNALAVNIGVVPSAGNILLANTGVVQSRNAAGLGNLNMLSMNASDVLQLYNGAATLTSVGIMTATTFVGNLTGNADTATTVSGNAATATKLLTARTIWGQNFDGTANISGALTYGGVTLSNAVTGTGNMVLSASPTFTGTVLAAAATFSGTTTISQTGNASLLINSGASGGSAAYVQHQLSGASKWYTGLNVNAIDGHFNIYDAANAKNLFDLTPNTGAVVFAGAVSGITTLATTSNITSGGYVLFNTNVTPVDGSIGKTSNIGINIQGATASIYDFCLTRPGGTLVFGVTTGTSNIVFNGGLSAITTLAGTGAVSGFTTINSSSDITAGGQLVSAGNTVVGSGGSGKLIVGNAATTNSSQMNVILTNSTAPTGNPTASVFLWANSGGLSIRGSGGGIINFDNAGGVSGITTLAGSGAISGFTSLALSAGITCTTVAGSAISGTSITATSTISTGITQAIGWGAASLLFCPVDSVIRLSNNAGTDFSRLLFGGTSSSFPGIKRNAAGLQFRLADDSAFCSVQGTTATFDVFTGGTISGTTGAFSSDLQIAATKKFYVDGGGDTYIIESAANQLDLIVGAIQVIRMNTTDIFLSIGSTVSAANVNWNGATGSLKSVSSSMRFKTGVTNLTLDDAAKLIFGSRPVSFRSSIASDDASIEYLGFIAEEIDLLDPRLCFYQNDSVHGLQYDRFIVPAVVVLQDHERRLQQLEHAALA